MPPVPTPSLNATPTQWWAFGSLCGMAWAFGGWHQPEVRHAIHLYQQQYPHSPADMREAERYAAAVRDAIHKQTMQRIIENDEHTTGAVFREQTCGARK